MGKSAAILLFFLVLLVAPAGPSCAWTGNSGWHGGAWHGGGWYGGGWHGGWHGTVIVGGGPWWWGYPYPYAYPYPYWYYPPPYPYPYPSAAVQGPSVYVQAPAAPAAGAQTYWYYCASSKAYYPKVEKCPEAWIKVPPTPE